MAQKGNVLISWLVAHYQNFLSSSSGTWKSQEPGSGCTDDSGYLPRIEIYGPFSFMSDDFSLCVLLLSRSVSVSILHLGAEKCNAFPRWSYSTRIISFAARA